MMVAGLGQYQAFAIQNTLKDQRGAKPSPAIEGICTRIPIPRQCLPIHGFAQSWLGNGRGPYKVYVVHGARTLTAAPPKTFPAVNLARVHAYYVHAPPNQSQATRYSRACNRAITNQSHARTRKHMHMQTISSLSSGASSARTCRSPAGSADLCRGVSRVGRKCSTLATMRRAACCVVGHRLGCGCGSGRCCVRGHHCHLVVAAVRAPCWCGKVVALPCPIQHYPAPTRANALSVQATQQRLMCALHPHIPCVTPGGKFRTTVPATQTCAARLPVCRALCCACTVPACCGWGCRTQDSL